MSKTERFPAKLGPRMSRALEGKRGLIERVVRVVAEEHQVRPDEILGPSRFAQIAQARHLAAYVIFSADPNISLRTIALGLGRNDHTTIMNSVKKAERLLGEDPDLMARVKQISEQILTS